MLQFWRNPEFIRHARAELRAPRSIAAGLLVLVICALVGLASWSAERNHLPEFFRTCHLWLVGIQFTLLGFWCASNCGQAISRERELKTYDFLKTTRLTSAELIIGKTLGAPIMAYFVVGCSLPVSLLAGLLGGYSVGTLLGVYALLIAFALFISLFGLWISMLLEKSSSGVVGLLALFP
ncbi:MAG: ABC transporter permease, partial [Terriglobales bacterium]